MYESIPLNWFTGKSRSNEPIVPNEPKALWSWLLFLRPPPNTQSAVMCAKVHQSTDARSERRSSPSPHSYETALGFDVIVCSLRLLRQPVSRTPSPSHPIPTLVGSIMVQAASCSTMVSAQWFSIANSGFNPSLFISTTFLSLHLFDSSSQWSLKPSPTGMFWTEQNWTVTGPGTSDGQLARNGRSVGDVVDAGTWRVGWWILIAMKVNEVDAFVAKENKWSVTIGGARENDQTR